MGMPGKTTKPLKARSIASVASSEMAPSAIASTTSPTRPTSSRIPMRIPRREVMGKTYVQNATRTASIGEELLTVASDGMSMRCAWGRAVVSDADVRGSSRNAGPATEPSVSGQSALETGREEGPPRRTSRPSPCPAIRGEWHARCVGVSPTGSRAPLRGSQRHLGDVELTPLPEVPSSWIDPWTHRDAGVATSSGRAWCWRRSASRRSACS